MVEVDDSLLLKGVALPAESGTERSMREMGLVDVREADFSLRVRLVYATVENFTGKVLYTDLRKAFLLPEMAERLKGAHRRLKQIRPDLRITVYDAARPMHVQQELWDRVKGTPEYIFVGNPAQGGGLHNYGAAVDVTLSGLDGQELDMGSAYDCFGEEARTDHEEVLLAAGKITRSAYRNRKLLRQVMTESGFSSLPGEWWHFNGLSRKEALATLKSIP